MEIVLKRIGQEKFDAFAQDVQKIFSIAVVEQFGEKTEEEIIPKAQVMKSLMEENAVVFEALMGGEKVGGIAVSIDEKTQCNEISLFYVFPSLHNNGLGEAILKKVEETFPETKVWKLFTPAFEKRNVNFYVNKCGFHITEYFNAHHKSPDMKEDPLEFEDEFFLFEKVMK